MPVALACTAVPVVPTLGRRMQCGGEFGKQLHRHLGFDRQQREQPRARAAVDVREGDVRLRLRAESYRARRRLAVAVAVRRSTAWYRGPHRQLAARLL